MKKIRKIFMSFCVSAIIFVIVGNCRSGKIYASIINMDCSDQAYQKVDISQYLGKDRSALSELSISDTDDDYGYGILGGMLIFTEENGIVNGVGLTTVPQSDDFINKTLNINPNIQGISLGIDMDDAVQLVSQYYIKKCEDENDYGYMQTRTISFLGCSDELLVLKGNPEDNKIESISLSYAEMDAETEELINEYWDDIEVEDNLEIPEGLLLCPYMGKSQEEEILFSFTISDSDELYGVMILADSEKQYLKIMGKIQEQEDGKLNLVDEETGYSLLFEAEELDDGSLVLRLSDLDYSTNLMSVSKDAFMEEVEKIQNYSNALDSDEEEQNYNMSDFVGVTGNYISTSGGSENCITMEIYDSGNGYMNVTFKSITHNGVVSAQGKITGINTVEADWNNAHFSLEWTDAGEVTVSRTGSTGYSDIDGFTEYENFINNSYYQVG